jgi:hypothetical protein
MLRVTVDLFSGRYNPTWIINNEKSETDLLSEIRKNKEIVNKPGTGFQGLGYRGIIFEMFNDEAESDFKLPATFSITNGNEKGHKKAVAIAARVIEEMTKFTSIQLAEHAFTPLDKPLQKQLLESLRLYDKKRPKIIPIRKLPPDRRIRVTVTDPECTDCKFEESRFNPGFWNDDSYVLWNNNCYNYSRDWKTNTFAQPGRASGHLYTALTCPAVSAAATSDGLSPVCNCLPESEYPRRLMALVIAPGSDYHWYRKQIGGFWGHKPGHTVARNVDNSGNVVVDPRTADRGPYTDFCGFFYAGKSVNII